MKSSRLPPRFSVEEPGYEARFYSAKHILKQLKFGGFPTLVIGNLKHMQVSKQERVGQIRWWHKCFQSCHSNGWQQRTCCCPNSYLPCSLLSNIACLYHHIELEDVGTLTYYLEQYQSLLPHVLGAGEVMLPKVQYL